MGDVSRPGRQCGDTITWPCYHRNKTFMSMGHLMRVLLNTVIGCYDVHTYVQIPSVDREFLLVGGNAVFSVLISFHPVCPSSPCMRSICACLDRYVLQ